MTAVSNFRIPQDLKSRAAAAALQDGKTLTEVVIEGLERYLDEREHR